MDQTIILVDDLDKFKGYTTWREGHYGKGKRHRGFVVLLFDEAGNVYLQKRKHRVFDGLWDLTAISHPYRLEKGTKGTESTKSTKGGYDESLEEAALRSLKVEMGIGKVELKDVGAFVYFAKDGDWCENEYCHVLVGKFNGRFKPNKKLVYGAKKVKFEEFVEDVKKDAELYTPWARETVKLVGEIREVGEVGGKELEEDLERFKGEFEKYAKQYFEQRTKLVRKYPKLIQTFYRELEEFGQGGKLLRPYLVWTGYRVSKKIATTRKAGLAMTSQIMPVCMAVELIHSFLLIHDDIIDRSDTRRGKLTVHKKFEKLNDAHYGTSMGLLAGDLAWVEAFELISSAKLDLQTKLQVLEKLQAVIKETIWGEVLDVEYSYRKANIDQIWQVIDLKTARYTFVGPLELGYNLGQIQGTTLRKAQGRTLNLSLKLLEEYGMLVGRAFQLRDDILGIFGDEKVTGKPGISDMREGKNTVLLYKALELSGQTNRQFISKVWGSEKATLKDLAQIKGIFEQSGALAWCEKKLEKMVGDAKKSAGLITKEKKLQQILEELAEMVVAREK